MEEDIKILKDVQWNCLHLRQYKDDTAERKAEAIENILNRLEQLEKENKELKHNNKIIEMNGHIFAEENKYLRENTIKKSIIKEKIEELKEIHKEQDWTQKQGFYYDCYNELLGGSNE